MTPDRNDDLLDRLLDQFTGPRPPRPPSMIPARSSPG